MGEGPASSGEPSSASALGAARLELGPLRNGLGSLKNLELLLRSIKVGQKDLFSAIAAVHADCAPMIMSAAALREALVSCGIEPGCAERLEGALSTSLQQLTRELAHPVESGRLSVAQRLKLEGVITRAVDELSAILPLAALLDGIGQRPPPERTPVALIHALDVEPAAGGGVPVGVVLPEGERCAGLGIRLDVGKLLLAIGIGLCAQGRPEQPVVVSFERAPGERPVTRIFCDPAAVPCVRAAVVAVVPPTLVCAEAALRGLGGKFDYSASDQRVCIWWPLS